MRRLALALVVVLVFAAAGGGAYLVIRQMSGPLSEVERVQLLQQAGLPPDFPVHPGARRMPQPKQGGVSYALRVPVPDALIWVRDALTRSGYLVHSGDIQGGDEYMTRWLDFQGPAGVRGAVLIRQIRESDTNTEVKILSHSDARLIAPLIQGRS